jgi:hypothetical protein
MNVSLFQIGAVTNIGSTSKYNIQGKTLFKPQFSQAQAFGGMIRNP